MTRRRDWTEARAKVDAASGCRVCGAISNLEAAHIIPRSIAPNGGEGANSIVELCQRDHFRYDNYQLDLAPYLTAEEMAQAVIATGSLASATRVISGRQ